MKLKILKSFFGMKKMNFSCILYVERTRNKTEFFIHIQNY